MDAGIEHMSVVFCCDWFRSYASGAVIGPDHVSDVVIGRYHMSLALWLVGFTSSLSWLIRNACQWRCDWSGSFRSYHSRAAVMELLHGSLERLTSVTECNGSIVCLFVRPSPSVLHPFFPFVGLSFLILFIKRILDETMEQRTQRRNGLQSEGCRTDRRTNWPKDGRTDRRTNWPKDGRTDRRTKKLTDG